MENTSWNMRDITWKKSLAIVETNRNTYNYRKHKMFGAQYEL